ncbi:MAG: hypothetical protein VX249_09455, partial [Pseudomonadota bacterium]|nr:hypothetical protein [Pseudomonadota bacterium]
NPFGTIPTYGGDTVLRMPRESAASEAGKLSALAHRFMEIQYQVDDLAEADRISGVIESLKALEAGGMGQVDPDTTSRNLVDQDNQEI